MNGKRIPKGTVLAGPAKYDRSIYRVVSTDPGYTVEVWTGPSWEPSEGATWVPVPGGDIARLAADISIKGFLLSDAELAWLGIPIEGRNPDTSISPP
jgi:hypothetical protein